MEIALTTVNLLQSAAKIECCTNKRHGRRVNSGQSLGSSKIGNFEHTAEHVQKNIVTLDVSVDNLVVMLANNVSHKILVSQQL